MKDGIDWAEVGSGGRFEKIVSVLLSTLHLQSRRIDGSGGDGGRDHQLVSGDRLDLWQSKYFLRRLSESRTRKPQIVKSLKVAADLRPDSWTLVTPMIPNPNELKWFEGLQGDYSFPLDWKGGDWLDARLKDHPSIVRSFMGANDEYVALLRELKEEREGAVDGLPAAADRIESLAAKINDANPFYRVDFAVSDGKIVSTGLTEKYPGAANDSPIKVQMNVIAEGAAVGSHIFEDLQRALDWGEEIVIGPNHIDSLVVEAPHGLGGSFKQPTIRLSPANKESVDLPVRLTLQDPDGSRLATLPIRMRQRVVAQRGTTLHGQDITGAVAILLRADWTTQVVSLNLSFATLPAQIPGAVLPALRFLNLATAPNQLSLVVGDTAGASTLDLPAGQLVSNDLIQIVEMLEKVQSAAGEPFPLPPEFTAEDLTQLRRASRLIDGHRVKIAEGTLTFRLLRQGAAALAGSGMFSLAIAAQDPYVANIAGHELPLGAFTYYVQRARLGPGEQPDGDGSYTVVPEPGFGLEVALGTLTYGAGLDAAEPV